MVVVALPPIFCVMGVTGEVDLQYYGVRKLNTKTDGVDITGELQCDSLDVDGNMNISINLNVTGIVTITSFVGDLTGDVTGNADTATTMTNVFLLRREFEYFL